MTEATDIFHRVPEVGTIRPRHRRAGYFVARHLFEGLDDFGDLEVRIAALPTQQDRGDAFEVFAEAYLATQKLVGAEEVWAADQVPIAVRRMGNVRPRYNAAPSQDLLVIRQKHKTDERSLDLIK